VAVRSLQEVSLNKNIKIIDLLMATNPGLLSVSLLLLRASAGIILFIVGSGKVFGWFGGQGFQLSVASYGKMGFSPPLAYLSIYTEFIGGGLLILGLLTRPAAFAITINMLVATEVMLPRGFIAGGAYSPFVLMIIALVILLVGPMAISLDYILVRRDEVDPESERVEEDINSSQ
jgi:putative oxidoreductase